ncbi:MAG: hypothetical protein KKH28_07710 [Elusimicrobia bacterium]|nr:hypothetical protein [Elusimicrobiota bacterium]
MQIVERTGQCEFSRIIRYGSLNSLFIRIAVFVFIRIGGMMKKILVLSALIFSAAGIKAQEFLPEGLPGLSDDPAQAGIQRPDSKRIMSGLSPALRLSSKQEERISGVITKKSKEFDKLLKKYDKAAAEEKRCREKVETLKSRMKNINKSIPDAIRGYLDDEQSQNFDDMLQARKKRYPAEAEVKKSENPAGAKPAKKRKLVRRKKKRPAVSSPEETPGVTMVDSEPSANPAPRVRKKKRVLRKKRKPAEDAAAEKPAGAGGAGMEAPDEDSAGEDAGSYP